MTDKNLHLHILPIVMVSISAFLVVTTISIRGGVFNSPNHTVSVSSASSALTTNIFNIKTYKNGFASIHLKQNSKPASTPTLDLGKSLSNEMSFNIAINQASASIGNKQ